MLLVLFLEIKKHFILETLSNIVRPPESVLHNSDSKEYLGKGEHNAYICT